MSDEFSTLKSVFTWLSAPLTFLLGLAGWHYKNVYAKVESLETSHQHLQILVHEHNVHVHHINETVRKLDDKLDQILKRVFPNESRAKGKIRSLDV